MSIIPGIIAGQQNYKSPLNVLSDDYWGGSSPPYSYNSLIPGWEVIHKQGAYGAMDPESFPAPSPYWNQGIRPNKIRLNFKYLGGLSSATIRFSVNGYTPLVPNQFLIVNSDVSINLNEQKEVTENLSWSGAEDESVSGISSLYPFIVENDPTPLFEIREITFLW